MSTIRMRNLRFSKSLFENYLTGTVLDRLLCSYSGLPQGVNYMIVGGPGVGKITYLTILQVIQSGAFISSNRLKHSITAMMELRLDNSKNISIIHQKHNKYGKSKIK